MAEIGDRLCIYCGKPAKQIRDGEHIIPQVIGGARTITTIQPHAMHISTCVTPNIPDVALQRQFVGSLERQADI
jgi:hypothetical protein